MIRDNNLFLDLIVDKDAKRQIKILEILSKEKIVFTRDLVMLLKVSRKTILSDIESIMKKSAGEIKVEVTIEGVFVTKNSENELQKAILIITNMTLSYRIIENYFRAKEIFKLDAVAPNLFASISTIKKRIFHINSIISKRFGCTLSTYKNTLIGPEANIRYFYFTYFTELQDLFNISVLQDTDEHKKIFNTLQEEIIRKKLKKINYSYFQLRQWLYVAKTRIELGHYIKIKRSELHQVASSKAFLDFSRVYIQIMRIHFDLKDFPLEEVVWAYINILDAITYSTNFPELSMSRDEEFLKEVMNSNYKLISKVVERFRLSEKEIDSFFRIFNAFFENLVLLNIVSSIYQVITPYVEKFVLDNFRHLYGIWYEEMLKHNAFESMNIIHKKSVCCKLALISSQFIYKKNSRLKRVLFSFTGESGVVSYLESVVENVFSNRCHIVFVFNELLSDNLVNDIKADIVVCNYNNIELLKNVRCLRISSIPNLRDWTKLLEQIFIDEVSI